MNYIKFRTIFKESLINPEMRKALESMLNDDFNFDLLALIDIAEKSKFDIRIVEVMTERKIDELSLDESLEVLSDFFYNIKSKKEKFQKLLSVFGFKVQAQTVTD